MTTRSLLNCLIPLSFLILVGYCLANAINNRSFPGISLALISLIAGIYFLYLLVRANERMEKEEST